MRKRYKITKTSCALCKPHKTGWSKRWNNKELLLLKEFEKVSRHEFTTPAKIKGTWYIGKRASPADA